jgi:S-adenosyl-L-methionine hydrolase (adenosine-forming)
MADGGPTITFLSDFGTEDESVGVVKSVIRSIAPAATVIDLTHGIAPHDVRAGSLALARAVQYVAPGVVLAVVDPGGGTERRAVAVEVGEGVATFVGPDNGLLASAVAMAGGATRAVHLTDDDYHLAAPSGTFAGRDVFAPVAAHLANGVDVAELGEAIDPLSLLPGTLPLSREEGAGLVAEVLWIDRYGNLQLNVDPDEAARFGERVLLRTEGGVRAATWSTAYEAIPPGHVGLVVDAYGLVSVCMARYPASAELGLEVGSAVTLEAGGDAAPRRPVAAQPVTLGQRPGEAR